MLNDFNKRIEAILKYSFNTMAEASEVLNISQTALRDIYKMQTTRLNTNTIEKFETAGFSSDWILNRLGHFANNKAMIYTHRVYLEKKLYSTSLKKKNEILFDYEKRSAILLNIAQEYLQSKDVDLAEDLISSLSRKSFINLPQGIHDDLKAIMDLGLNPYYLAGYEACDPFTVEFQGSTLYHKYITALNTSENSSIKKRIGLPLFDIDATGGDVYLLNDTNESPIDYISLPNLKGRAAIIVHGDSMAPIYSNQDIVTIDKQNDSKIMFGKAYLIITENQRMIKFLLPSDNDDKLLCKSANTNGYPDYEISKKDIIKLFIIKGCIKTTEQ